MGKNNGYRPGALFFSAALILTGVLMILGGQIPVLGFQKLWPLFLMLPVIIFIELLLDKGKKVEGVWVPLVILSLLTVYFLFLNFTGWGLVAVTWPVFIMIPGLSLLALYFSNRQSALLIPVFILLLLSGVFFGFTFKSSMIAGVMFIIGGLYIVIRSIFRFGARDNA